jgi:hypothetical protein
MTGAARETPCMRSRSGSLSILAVAVVVAVTVAVGLAGGGAAPAWAQDADRDPGEPCVPGATQPAPGRTVSGPSPVGRCEPSTSRRALDLGTWVVTVGSLVAVAGLGVALAHRDRRSAPAGVPTDGA